MKTAVLMFALLLPGFALAAPTPADTVDAPPAHAADAPAPITLKGISQFDLDAKGDHRYRIFVSVPDKPAPKEGYAVLYVLDANAMFLTAVETVRAVERRPDVPRSLATVVVGVGYPDGVDIGKARAFDLTPPGSGSPRFRGPSGGADAFLAFIKDQLHPRIASMVTVDPKRQALFGHSFGGLFVLYSMLQDPDAFPIRMAASPSLWFAPADFADKLENSLAKRPDDAKPLQLLLTVGEYEQALSPLANAQPHVARLMQLQNERAQVDRSRQLAEALIEHTRVDARFDEIAGEDHGSVIPAAISRAAAFMLMPRLAVPSVPSGQEYWDMTPDERYDLRMWVRQLPDRRRIPWLTRLRDALHEGLTEEQVKILHDERDRLDAERGTRPHEVNAPTN